MAKIHAAMEACKGDRREAAEILGLSKERLDRLVKSNPILKARWRDIEEQPPDDIDGIARAQIDPEEERLQFAIEAETHKFAMILSRSKLLRPHQVESARELQKIGNLHMGSMMDVTNASLGIVLMKLGDQVTILEERLREVRQILAEMGGEISEERMAKVEEEKGLILAFNTTSDNIRKITATFDQCAMNAAVIKYRLRNGAGAKRAKPGFSPIDVQSS